MAAATLPRPCSARGASGRNNSRGAYVHCGWRKGATGCQDHGGASTCRASTYAHGCTCCFIQPKLQRTELLPAPSSEMREYQPSDHSGSGTRASRCYCLLKHNGTLHQCNTCLHAEGCSCIDSSCYTSSRDVLGDRCVATAGVG